MTWFNASLNKPNRNVKELSIYQTIFSMKSTYVRRISKDFLFSNSLDHMPEACFDFFFYLFSKCWIDDQDKKKEEKIIPQQNENQTQVHFN